MRNLRWLLLYLLSLSMAACAYPISEQLREEVTEDVSFQMVLKNPSAYVGDIVLWGGFILRTENLKEGVEIFVLDTPLDYWEDPEPEQYSRGRFIAKTAKFLDPAVYKKGRKITLAGEIIGGTTLPLGEAQYTYPVVMIKQIHLWKKAPYYPYYYYPGGWYGPYYGPFYEPGYGYDEDIAPDE
jgi:outer membrane lipoprotein